MTQQLPTRTTIFANALESLDTSRNALSDVRDWLNSDWSPMSATLPSAAADARSSVRRKIAEAKVLIDEAKGDIISALDALGREE